jgi:hypothetical protein
MRYRRSPLLETFAFGLRLPATRRRQWPHDDPPYQHPNAVPAGWWSMLMVIIQMVSCKVLPCPPADFRVCGRVGLEGRPFVQPSQIERCLSDGDRVPTYDPTCAPEMRGTFLAPYQRLSCSHSSRNSTSVLCTQTYRRRFLDQRSYRKRDLLPYVSPPFMIGLTNLWHY